MAYLLFSPKVSVQQINLHQKMIVRPCSHPQCWTLKTGKWGSAGALFLEHFRSLLTEDEACWLAWMVFLFVLYLLQRDLHLTETEGNFLPIKHLQHICWKKNNHMSLDQLAFAWCGWVIGQIHSFGIPFLCMFGHLMPTLPVLHECEHT